MNFKTHYNSILKEEETSKEDKLNALKGLATSRKFKVVEVVLSRGFARLGKVYQEQAISLQEACDVAREKCIVDLKKDYEDVREANDYIDEWVGEPICKEDIDVGGCPTGEETTLLVIGSRSIYWDMDIIENLDEIMEHFDWFNY